MIVRFSTVLPRRADHYKTDSLTLTCRSLYILTRAITTPTEERSAASAATRNMSSEERHHEQRSVVSMTRPRSSRRKRSA